MKKVTRAVSLAQKIVEVAKKELNEEKEKNLTEQAKQLLDEIQASKKTVILLERQLQNFMREVELDN
jgi:vacuolar-type H+-ATPase subunit H